jgi:hypothetical protein
MSDLSGPLDDVIADYNSAGVGVTLERTGTQCSGPFCILVGEAAIPGEDNVGPCAQTAVPTNSGSGGAATNATTVTLQTGYGTTESWRTADPTQQRRTAAHELGHALGMDHPVNGEDCDSVNDSVMLDAITNCQDSTSGYSPTMSDTLPMTNTVYGTGSRSICGFPQ